MLAAFADIMGVFDIFRIAKRAEDLALQQFAEADHGIERRAQLVADMGDEIGFHAGRLLGAHLRLGGMLRDLLQRAGLLLRPAPADIGNPALPLDRVTAEQADRHGADHDHLGDDELRLAANILQQEDGVENHQQQRNDQSGPHDREPQHDIDADHDQHHGLDHDLALRHRHDGKGGERPQPDQQGGPLHDQQALPLQARMEGGQDQQSLQAVDPEPQGQQMQESLRRQE